MFKALAPHVNPLALAAGALAGCGIYYLLPFEPAWWWGVAVMALGWTVLAAAEVILPMKPAGLLILALGGYFALAQGQVMQADRLFNWEQAVRKTPWVVGLVDEVQPGKSPGRAMLTLHKVRVYGLSMGPARLESLRVGVSAKQAQGLKQETALAFPVGLFAPEGPRFPSEGDYRLLRYVDPGTPVGYAKGPLELTYVPEAPPHPIQPYDLSNLGRGIADMTDILRDKVKAATAPYGQGVITALLLADERQIPQSLRNAYLGAGLTHLLAVSGMQLTLVGGGVFWLVRWLLSLWPALALEIDTKAIGALFGLAAAGGYTVLAGAPVSVQRALVMIALLLLAVVLGRMRSLIRCWCLAVLAVLAWNPSAATMAGFQLSFAAVLGLILLGMAHGHPETWWQKGRWLFRSSVVAAWITAPIIAFQFAQLNVLGVLANMVAIPAMTPVTLLAFAGLTVMPVTSPAPLFALAGAGADWVNAWAVKISSIPLATVPLPLWSAWVVLAVALAVLALVYGRLKGASFFGFLLLLGLGCLSWMWQQQAVKQVLVLDGGAAAVMAQGHGARPLWGEEARAAASWMRRNGLAALGPHVAGRCDDDGCLYDTPLGHVMELKDGPTPDDCSGAALVVAAEPGACPAKTLVLDQAAWARLTPRGAEIRKLACNRPWQMVAEACWHKHATLETDGTQDAGE
jgi:competence protein ComEC